ncbi:MAG: hypothetical protein K2I93_08465, partial [Oscillospiraceae bacterium]|nr:hypothetical protein [Oscillospiraceae bacterium]
MNIIETERKAMTEKKAKKVRIEDGGIGYVKGYDLQSVSMKKLEKGKLGHALSAVTDMEVLAQEIRSAKERHLPVWGYFKKGQLWSCYLFETVQVEKSAVEPTPKTSRDVLNLCKIKHVYLHPDVEQYADEMMQGIFTSLKEHVLSSPLKGDNSYDGFILNGKVHICRRIHGGIPFGVLCLVLCLLWGVTMDNMPLGLCIG